MPRAVLLALSDAVDESNAAEFNRWWSDIHLPEIVELPGFVSGRRFKLSSAQVKPDDRVGAGQRFLAVIELDCDDLEGAMKTLAESVSGFQPTDTLQRDPPPIGVLFEEI